MTLEEAKKHVGEIVIYRPAGNPDAKSEEGEITSVNDSFVFVRYEWSRTSQATYARDLTLSRGGVYHG